VECRLRKLTKLLDSQANILDSLELQPYPMLFKSADKKYKECMVFYYGFRAKNLWLDSNNTDNIPEKTIGIYFNHSVISF
jgi:hypothetical protein